MTNENSEKDWQAWVCNGACGRVSSSPQPGATCPDRALKHSKGVLAAKFDEDLANMVIAQAFVMFVEQNMPSLCALRIKYATHYHNNCVRDGAPRNAGRWQDVIDDIESR